MDRIFRAWICALSFTSFEFHSFFSYSFSMPPKLDYIASASSYFEMSLRRLSEEEGTDFIIATMRNLNALVASRLGIAPQVICVSRYEVRFMLDIYHFRWTTC